MIFTFSEIIVLFCKAVLAPVDLTKASFTLPPHLWDRCNSTAFTLEASMLSYVFEVAFLFWKGSKFVTCFLLTTGKTLAVDFLARLPLFFLTVSAFLGLSQLYSCCFDSQFTLDEVLI